MAIPPPTTIDSVLTSSRSFKRSHHQSGGRPSVQDITISFPSKFFELQSVSHLRVSSLTVGMGLLDIFQLRCHRRHSSFSTPRPNPSNSTSQPFALYASSSKRHQSYDQGPRMPIHLLNAGILTWLSGYSNSKKYRLRPRSSRQIDLRKLFASPEPCGYVLWSTTDCI
ncbi:uncharacterized protein BDV14DRAFT_90243 [Aspergillus stella-maris]|uniref:uncharacterized protein n=1 Tax=Aspergillus stella-maris TaxID=1810926 RepID=UPI003CCD0DFD